LVILRSPELDLRITQLTRELQGATGKSFATTSESDRRVEEIKAELESRRNQLQFEIDRLMADRDRNRELTSKLQSLPKVTAHDTNDAIMQQVRSYQRELEMAEVTAKSQISVLRGGQGLQRTIGQAERAAMERELQLLQAELSRLVIVSQTNSLVGSVHAHVGEKVSPFDTILTLTPHAPTFVRGYIPEKVYNRVQLGDVVQVSPLGEHGGKVSGEVIGVGSRIVEFPVHLRKIPDLVIYGREVTIRIPQENEFLLGELVGIRPQGLMSVMTSGGAK